MSDELGDEVDEILSDFLGDIGANSAKDVEESVTFAQAVSGERQTSIINNRMDWYAGQLEIPDATVTLAKSLCEQYRNQRGDLLGTALEFVATSCLYCAVKVTEGPLDPTDFVEVEDTVVSRKGLLRRSKDIASTLGIDPSAFFESNQYVDRYCEDLDVSKAVNARAHRIIEITENSGLSSGKSPSGWAAAAVYNACLDVKQKRTQKELSDVRTLVK